MRLAPDIRALCTEAYPSIADIAVASAPLIAVGGGVVDGLLRGVSLYPQRHGASTVLCTEGGQVFVPDADNLREKILTLAHSCAMGHCGVKHTLRTVKEYFVWDDMKADVKAFVQACIMCLPTSGGRVPVPLAAMFHTHVRNRLLHIDYMFVEEPRPTATHKFKYLLVIKDDASGYVWLRPTETCDSRSVAHVLVEWCSTFGVFDMLNSDGGTHFTSSIIRELTETLRIDHHIVTPYTPFANGTIERDNSTVVQCLRILLIETDTDMSDWPYLLPTVQSACNALRRERLGWSSPQHVFTSHDPYSALGPCTCRTQSGLCPLIWMTRVSSSTCRRSVRRWIAWRSTFVYISLVAPVLELCLRSRLVRLYWLPAPRPRSLRSCSGGGGDRTPSLASWTRTRTWLNDSLDRRMSQRGCTRVGRYV